MAENAEATAEAGPAKKQLPIMAIGIVAALMLIEAVGVYLLVGMTSASGAGAAELEVTEADPGEQIVEVAMVKDRFQNRTTGRVWEWQAEVVLKVRQKNSELVTGMLEQRKAELKEGVGKIFAAALDRHLSDPGRTAIDRQVTVYVNEVFGTDEEGVPRIEDVLIPTLSGKPADF